MEVWLGESFQLRECLFVHHEKSYSYVETTSQRNRLGEPTSFLDHVYLGCTQRQCEISKDIVDNCRTMFESRISAV